ncbi:MAG: hypothetical protein QNJ20_04000 [Paracoccaceae bacterium]|nr:hypothetical protein [Paracoccaceae bacterium]
MGNKDTNSPFTWMTFDAENLFAPHVTHLIAAQGQVFTDTADYAQRWIDRQNTSAQATIDMMRQMSGASDIAAAWTILRDWQTQSMELAAEDAREWVALCKDCVDRFVTEEIEAEAEVVGVGKTAKRKDKLPTRIPV